MFKKFSIQGRSVDDRGNTCINAFYNQSCNYTHTGLHIHRDIILFLLSQIISNIGDTLRNGCRSYACGNNILSIQQKCVMPIVTASHFISKNEFTGRLSIMKLCCKHISQDSTSSKLSPHYASLFYSSKLSPHYASLFYKRKNAISTLVK